MSTNRKLIGLETTNSENPKQWKLTVKTQTQLKEFPEQTKDLDL